MLKQGVVYRQYGDIVYVRDIPGKHALLLNDIAKEILDFFSEHPQANVEALIRYMQSQYGDEPSIAQDMRDFIDPLTAMGILFSTTPEEDRSEERVTSQVNRITMASHLLLNATLELTYRCNERCIHCYVDDDLDKAREQELTLPEYRDLLDQLYAMGCMHLLLTGGEVCLRDDFIDIAEYAVQKGFCVDVFTNGIAVTDELFDRMSRMGLNSVSFSLYGGTAAVHDRITRVPGSFDKTLHRLMMFKCAEVNTFIKTVTMRQNIDDFEALMQLAQRLKLRVLNSMMITPSHTGGDANRYRLNDVNLYLQAMRTENRYQPFPCASEPRKPDAPICTSGQNRLSVDPYGNVFPCLSLPVKMGNIRSESLAAIWNKKEPLASYASLRIRDLECHPEQCQYNCHCQICMGTSYMENGGHIRPVQESCLLAQAYAQMEEGESSCPKGTC